ncbi:MAG: carbohydrate binding family 9 domain-containing protein [Acidobacteria bacterium]|nr:carbohydrate binding family 9 domain-containing protein [Acidobacteriota bacterium]
MKRTITTRCASLLLLVALCAVRWPVGVVGQNGASFAVGRMTGKVALDGVLDEPNWTQAPALSEILQREPKQEVRASERTEVKLLADQATLYIGVRCYDSAPEKVVGTQMRRDASLEADDRIEILLDTFHDRRNAFYFATNPAGALVDGLVIENGRQINFDWNAIWDVRVKRNHEGWTAEFALPFKSLGFTPGQDVWGFNFARYIVRKLEEDRWATPRLDVRFTQVSEAGELSGFAAAEQGRGLDVRPYVIGNVVRDASGKSDFKGQGGADIFFNITSSLKLTTTINTDFAETEVDDRQINLTRFPLFFPEKRSFFLENAGVFNFTRSAGNSELLPFFSRRIGLLSGSEVPILAGAKLTGKAGKYDLGALAVRTRATSLTNSSGQQTIEAKNFFVGRVKRNLFKQSYLGALYTEGDPGSATTSRTLGADLRLATANLLGSQRNFSVDMFVSKTSKQAVNGDDAAYGVFVNYPNDRWDAFAEWKHIGRAYNPALGFVARKAVDKLYLGAVFKPRPKKFLNVRQMFHEMFFTQYRRNDLARGVSTIESWRFFTAPINWDFNSGDRVEANWAPQFEHLFQPFEIADGIVLPPGDYRFTRYRAEFNTAAKRPWEFGATWWFGSFYSGHADQIEAEFIYKFAPHFRLALQTEQTFARLKEGRFVARVYSLRADYAFSPLLSLSNLVQFDNESRNLGWQSRVRWILKPGNDLFVVFNQGWLQNERGGYNFRATSTKLAGKLQYTFRF